MSIDNQQLICEGDMEEYPKINTIELYIYNILGICYFQKLVFLLEKFIHRKDGKTNQNYHFNLDNINPMEDFIRFLFFNGSIHFRNVCIFIIYCIIKVLYFSFYWYDIVLLILIIKDIYCIMLQRYNYLRIKKVTLILEKQRKNRIEKKVNKLFPIFKENYDVSTIKEDLELIHKIKRSIEDKTVVFFDEKDEKCLKRLVGIANKVTNLDNV